MFKFKILILTLVLISTPLFSQNLMINENSVKFENSTTASIAGENGIVLRTTDKGNTWVEQNTNVTNVLNGFSSYNGISLAAGENGVIIRSTDNGDSWSTILVGTIQNFNDIEISGSNVAVCGNNGTLYHSTDAGASWNICQSNTIRDLYDVKFISSSVGYVAGDTSTLLKTTDGGNTWSDISLTFCSARLNSVEAIDEDNIAVAGNEGTVFLSNDGGLSWYRPSGLMYETNLNEIVFFSATDGMIVGNDGLMLKTVDGGMSWQPVNTSFSGDLYDFQSVAFSDISNGISVGVNGVEVYSTDGGDTWTENAPDRVDPGVSVGSATGNIILKQNYPNPFNPSTNISYDIPFNANVTLKVYDIAGREVASLVSAYQVTGNYTAHFDASNLSSGVYIYKLVVNNGLNTVNKVNKMILTK